MEYETNFPHFVDDDAYSKLLMNVLQGRQESFVRDDELERSWELIMPVLNHQEDALMKRYAQGSSGPRKRKEFLERMGIEDSTRETIHVRGTVMIENGNVLLRSFL